MCSRARPGCRFLCLEHPLPSCRRVLCQCHKGDSAAGVHSATVCTSFLLSRAHTHERAFLKDRGCGEIVKRRWLTGMPATVAVAEMAMAGARKCRCPPQGKASTARWPGTTATTQVAHTAGKAGVH